MDYFGVEYDYFLQELAEIQRAMDEEEEPEEDSSFQDEIHDWLTEGF